MDLKRWPRRYGRLRIAVDETASPLPNFTLSAQNGGVILCVGWFRILGVGRSIRTIEGWNGI